MYKSVTFIRPRTAVVDLALIAAALLIPTLSHLTAWPVYRLNPMLLILLCGMLLTDSRRNSLMLAVALPMVSSVVVGMPAFGKAICMAAELATTASLYSQLPRRRRWPAVWGGMALSILCGKGVYYLLKGIFLGGAQEPSAPVWVPLLTVVVYSLLFALLTVWAPGSRGTQCGHGRC
ncbi:MAG: hypothetical protein AUK63_477 [bacterium P3]|nr:MAG: hypothetical protein AUK63_477 [bacterium P3]KWW41933.1 MAG: hypothetical protein F083_584 [bacterium F083]